MTSVTPPVTLWEQFAILGIIFLGFAFLNWWQDRRDKQWQEFFIKISKSNQDVIDKLVERIEKLTDAMSDHDEYVRRNLPATGERRKDGGRW